MKRASYVFGFCIKKNRIEKDGKAPIYLRITINNERREKSANLSVNPKKWNYKLGLCEGNDSYSLTTNDRLNVIKTKALESYTALSSIEIPTVDMVLNKLLGIKTEIEKERHYLMPFFKEHNLRCQKLCENKQMAHGTVERYETSYKHTLDFMKAFYNIDDIEFCNIDRTFIDDYEFYLKTKSNNPCSHNSTVKYLKNFRKIILMAIRKKLIVSHP